MGRGEPSSPTPTPRAPPSPVLTTLATAAAAAAAAFVAATSSGDDDREGSGGGSSSLLRRCGASTYTSSAVFLSFLLSWRVRWLNICVLGRSNGGGHVSAESRSERGGHYFVAVHSTEPAKKTHSPKSLGENSWALHA